MGIHWNIYLGTSTPDIMRINMCALMCVWGGVCACACLSLRGCTTRAQNSLTKNSSVLHFNDLILHKLISKRFLSQTCMCVRYLVSWDRQVDSRSCAQLSDIPFVDISASLVDSLIWAWGSFHLATHTHTHSYCIYMYSMCSQLEVSVPAWCGRTKFYCCLS